eukprot:6212157-Pleurochrysis_carterae.AAC.3
MQPLMPNSDNDTCTKQYTLDNIGTSHYQKHCSVQESKAGQGVNRGDGTTQLIVIQFPAARANQSGSAVRTRSIYRMPQRRQASQLEHRRFRRETLLPGSYDDVQHG